MRTTSSMVGRDLGCGPADATGISRAMSYQYDIEDQADLTGVVMTEGLDWREQYVPVAPVQLTRAWSPLPLAVEPLGPPDWTSVG